MTVLDRRDDVARETASNPAAPASEPVIGLAAGQLLGWGALAIVNAIVIARTFKVPRGHASLRVFHHLYDAGHLIAAGLLATAAVALWQRLGPRRPIWGYLAIALFFTLLGAPLLSVDLIGPAATLARGHDARPFLWLLFAVVGAGMATVALVGRLLARPWLFLIGVLAGLAGGYINHRILENDYPGVHLYLAAASAIVIGTSIGGVRRRHGRPLPRPVARLQTFGAWLHAPLALFGSWAIVADPTNAVALELLRLPGSVFAPVLARLRAADLPPKGALAKSAWLSDAARSDVPASIPALLRPDALVILIVVDALRADVVDGSHAKELPTFDAMRARSLDFTGARSPTTGTIWTLSTLFASRYYSQLYWSVKPGGVTAKPYAHEDPAPRFPEVLSRGGVRTALVHEMPDVTNAYGTVRGFEEEIVIRRKGSTGRAVISAAIDRLGKLDKKPTFLYVHLLDAHSPYDRGGKEGTLFERYVREVAFIDRELGRLETAIDELGLRDRTTTILTADHGEAFGEHDTWHHGVSVYEELVRVPLWIHVPGVAPRKVAGDVSLIDLGPTILDLMGQTTPRSFMGQSLVPFVRGGEASLSRPMVIDTGRWQQAMIFPDHFKVIRDRRRGTFELYDLSTDPDEQRNLFDEPASGADARLEQLSAFFYANTLKRPGYTVPFRP